MANIGLRNAKYNLIDFETKKYKQLKENKVPILGKLIEGKIEEERSEASLFGDDALAEYVSSFSGAKLNLTVDDVEDPAYAELKGCTITETEITENENDEAPEIGYGHIVTKMIRGVKKYKVEFLPRVRITKISSDAKTKGESIEFNTVSLEGKVMALETDINGLKAGDWRKIETFATLKEATDYLDGLLTPLV